MEVDGTGLPILDGIPPETVRAAFGYFFSNRPKEALQFFAGHEHVPLLALGKATVLFSQAVISFDDEDIEKAVEALNHASVNSLFSHPELLIFL